MKTFGHSVLDYLTFSDWQASWSEPQQEFNGNPGNRKQTSQKENTDWFLKITVDFGNYMV